MLRNFDCSLHNIQRKIVVAHKPYTGPRGHRRAPGHPTLRREFNGHKGLGVEQLDVSYAELVLIFYIPYQEALIVRLPVILLHDRSAVAYAAFMIQNLISLVNISEHCIIVATKNRHVVIAMLHYPANICLYSCNRSVINGNIDLTWI